MKISLLIIAILLAGTAQAGTGPADTELRLLDDRVMRLMDDRRDILDILQVY
jgi:hypothetical protein